MQNYWRTDAKRHLFRLMPNRNVAVITPEEGGTGYLLTFEGKSSGQHFDTAKRAQDAVEEQIERQMTTILEGLDWEREQQAQRKSEGWTSERNFCSQCGAPLSCYESFSVCLDCRMAAARAQAKEREQS
jgi:ribosomal protein S14